MFLSVDALTARILQCNETVAVATGYSREEIIGKPIFEMYHPDSLEGAKKAFESFKTTGEVRDAELQLRREDGSKIDVTLNVSAVRDEQGNILRSRSVWRDITERKKAEEDRDDLAKFPSENPNPVLRIAKDGKVLYSNQAGELLLGKWESGIGKTVPEKWLNSIAKAFASEKGVEEEVEGKIFSVAVASIKEAGYVNLYARDVTERRAAEENLRESYARLEEQSMSLAQSEKMNAVGTLVAGTAHELNNPVMGILNFAEHCMKHTSKEDQLYTVMEDIEREARRCAEIVQNLLTFSYTEQEDLRAYQKSSLPDVLDRVLRLLAYRIEEQKISLTRQIAEDTPEIWMDPSGMQQVLLSLITNSLDAMEDSEKRDLNVDIRGEGEFVKMTIADSGCGIPPESIGSLFDPFFTTKPVGKGTGLGLSVSQGIVKAHRGQIACESEPGVRTQFVVLLPIERRKERAG